MGNLAVESSKKKKKPSKKPKSSSKKSAKPKSAPQTALPKKMQASAPVADVSLLQQLQQLAGNNALVNYLKSFFADEVNAPAPVPKTETKTAAPTQSDQSELGVLSSKFESNGNPGTVSIGKGDVGGKSYGAYQFNSTDGIIIEFYNWLKDQNHDIYAQLEAGYVADGNKNGSHFDDAFKKIGNENKEAFLKLQHDFTKKKYYDGVAQKIKDELGLDINARSFALQNVLWSRSVQHGQKGVFKLFKTVLASMDVSKATDEEIIRAVYKESGKVIDTGKNKMEGKDAETRNVGGKYMKYFSGNDSKMQLGVWKRLNLQEPEKALKLLYGNDYKFTGL